MIKKLQLFTIPFLFLLIPLYQALTNLHISFSHKEISLILLVILLISIFISISLIFTNNKLRVLLLTAVVFIFFDITFQFRDLIGIIVPKDYITLRLVRLFLKLFILSLTYYLIYKIFWNLRVNIISILAIFFSVTAITTVINQPLPKFNNSSDLGNIPIEAGNLENLPIILHIIFDELLSPEAINLNIESGRELHSKMLKINDDFGFRNFGRIYSRHFFSPVSIPNMFDSEYDTKNMKSETVLTHRLELIDNAYFDDMVSRGYKIKIYQTTHLDFCKYKNITKCNTFDSFDPNWISSFNEGNDKLFYLLKLISRGYRGSYSGDFVAVLIDMSTKYIYGHDKFTGQIERFDVVGFPSWFDKYIFELANTQRGNMIFSHFMVPHAPYNLTNDCQVNNLVSDAGYYLGEKFGVTQENLHEKRQIFQNEYYTQSICVLNKITELLNTIDRLPQFDDAIIIIHGDHGSRISIGNHVEDYDERDFIDNYATFYAIRSPDIKAGYDCRLISLPRLFSHHMTETGKISDLVNNPQSVYVLSNNKSNEFMETKMPYFPCANGIQ